MALVHVSGADPHCSICHGSGVKPFMGFGTPCNCTPEMRDRLSAEEAGRKAADRAFQDALEKVFNAPMSDKTKAALKAIDDMTVISPRMGK